MDFDIPIPNGIPHSPPHSDPHKEPGGLWHEPDKVARQAETPVARFPSEQTHPSLSQLLPAMSFLVHKYCIFNMHKMEPTLAGHFAKRSNLFAPSIALHF